MKKTNNKNSGRKSREWKQGVTSISGKKKGKEARGCFGSKRI